MFKRDKYQVVSVRSNTENLEDTKCLVSEVFKSYKDALNCFDSYKSNAKYSIPDYVVKTENEFKKWIQIDNEDHFRWFNNEDYPEFFIEIKIKNL